jgi:hypothetical protein
MPGAGMAQVDKYFIISLLSGSTVIKAHANALVQICIHKYFAQAPLYCKSCGAQILHATHPTFSMPNPKCLTHPIYEIDVKH